MPMIEIYPMTFEPVFRNYLWGGETWNAFSRSFRWDCCRELGYLRIPRL